MVDDGAGGIVISTVKGNAVCLARIADPTRASSFTSVTWSAGLSGATLVADIWHVWAHDFHWIVYCDQTNPPTDLWLIQVDTGLNLVGGPWLIVSQSGAPVLPSATYPHRATNDPFVVNGGWKRIAIGVSNHEPGNQGLAIVWISTDPAKVGSLVGSTSLGEADGFRADGGGSAVRRTEKTTLGWKFRYHLIATTSLNAGTGSQSDVRLYDFDTAWDPTTATEPGIQLLGDTAAGTEYAMGTLQSFSGVFQYYLLTCRYRDGSHPVDDGTIVRHWFGPGLTGGPAAGADEILETAASNRPHTLLWGDDEDGRLFLFTCWSVNDQGIHQRVQCEEVTR